MSKKFIRLIGLIVIAVGFIMYALGTAFVIPRPFKDYGLWTVVAGIAITFLVTMFTRSERREVYGDRDNLTRLEGIGSKTKTLLGHHEIRTFNALAEKTPEELTGILEETGKDNLPDPSSWPKQARLAAQGRWNELDKLKEELKKQ